VNSCSDYLTYTRLSTTKYISQRQLYSILVLIIRTRNLFLSTMPQRIAFTVHGKVQGVFFRDFTQQKANAYGITGWVKNSSNGKVVGEAQGDSEALSKLKKDLNQGPSSAHVVKLETKEIEPKSGESSFDS